MGEGSLLEISPKGTRFLCFAPNAAANTITSANVWKGPVPPSENVKSLTN